MQLHTVVGELDEELELLVIDPDELVRVLLLDD